MKLSKKKKKQKKFLIDSDDLKIIKEYKNDEDLTLQEALQCSIGKLQRVILEQIKSKKEINMRL